MDIRHLIACCMLGFFITGCSSSDSNNVKTATVAEIESQSANIKLAEAASTVSNTLTNVAAVQRATTPPLAMRPLPDANSYNMDSLASVDWAGPVGPLVAKIAAASGYRLRVLGARPALPVLVSINVKNMSLGYILRDLDYQAGSKANIVVFPERSVIELCYARS